MGSLPEALAWSTCVRSWSGQDSELEDVGIVYIWDFYDIRKVIFLVWLKRREGGPWEIFFWFCVFLKFGPYYNFRVSPFKVSFLQYIFSLVPHPVSWDRPGNKEKIDVVGNSSSSITNECRAEPLVFPFPAHSVTMQSWPGFCTAAEF